MVGLGGRMLSDSIQLKGFKTYVDRCFAELNHDEPDIRKSILEFFESKIESDIGDHDTVGLDSSQQSIHHLCYDCHIDKWNQLFELFVPLALSCQVNLDWRALKPFMRFSFIGMKPGGKLPPHIGHYLPCLTAFNIPLKGCNSIEVFETSENFKMGRSLGQFSYTNPIFLNVYNFHSSFNPGEFDRLILKVHLGFVSWSQLVESYNAERKKAVFDDSVPWARELSSPNPKKKL
jgi:hypothetical protein